MTPRNGGQKPQRSKVLALWSSGREVPMPHSLEAERAVLGALMINPDGLADVVSIIQPGDFYRDNHNTIYDLLLRMSDAGKPIEMVSVVEQAMLEGIQEEVGGITYVSSLSDDIPSTENIAHYATLVREYAERRALLQESATIAMRLQHDGCSASEARSELARAADAGEAADARTGTVTSILSGIGLKLASEASGASRLYIPTGIATLDDSPHFGGLTTQGVTLIIAASSMGKTSLLNRFALGSAWSGYRVMIHGTETNVERRTRDLLFSLAGVSTRAWGVKTAARARIKAMGGRHLPFEEDIQAMSARIQRAEEELSRLPPIEVSGAGQTVEQVARTARRLRRRGELDVLFADYLQDFVPSPGMRDKKDNAAHVSMVLKNLSAELTIPVVVGAQRRDEMTLTINEKTTMSDLIPQMKDVQHTSGAFQDAEEVYALYRADYYIDRYKDTGAHFGEPGILYVVARKLRSGMMASYGLEFTGPSKWVGDRPDEWAFGDEVME